MKKLSEVTFKDAKQIIKAGYEAFFNTDNWKFRDDSEVLDEPCKCLYSRSKAYDFTFYDDDISITSTTDEAIFNSPWEDVNFDTKIECYVEAHNLGYHVEKFSNLKALH